jgi:hypothetical protein
MTKKAKQKTNEEVKKLMIDKPSDFRFHAAYIAYSEAWDQSASEETRTELNEIISSLSKEEISYSDFYKMLGQYGTRGSQHHIYPRKRIETQRKRDWRKRQTREARNARHRRRR